MTNVTTLVSIIVPAYNVERYIKACLESILNQNAFEKFEVICIDDASTDGTANIIKDISMRYNNLKFIRNEHNIGVSLTRNKALNIASGQYIMFVDSDDLLAPNALQLCYSVAIQKDLDILCFKADCISEYGCYPFLSSECQMHLKNINKGYINHIAYITNIWMLFYKRDFLENINIKFSNKRIFEDWEFLWSIYAHTEKVHYIDKTLYFYRTDGNQNSLTKGFRTRKWGFDLLLQAYQDSCKEFENEKIMPSFEYVCLQRACEIFFHFFIHSKTNYKQLKDDIKIFSDFLNHTAPIILKKVISDTFSGFDNRIIQAVISNTLRDRLMLFCMLGSNASNDIYCCYKGIKSALNPMVTLGCWMLGILQSIKHGFVGFCKVIRNIIRKHAV